MNENIRGKSVSIRPVGLLLLLVMTLMSGCAAGLSNTRYSYSSSELSDANSGIVVGRVLGGGESGTGLGFLRVDTGESFSYYGAKTFCFRAPAGTYALSSIGTRGGSIASKDPFSFSVENGKPKYVGTISVSGVYPDPMETNRPNVKSYGYNWGSDQDPTIGGGYYEVTVRNRLSDVNPGYEKDCPGLDWKTVEAEPMS